MTRREAYLHLQARAKIQREQKTSYNRLRWTKADIEEVEVLLATLRAAATRQVQA